MKKTLLFCGLFAIAACNFMSCDDEDENNNNDNTTNNGGNTTNNGGGATSNLSGEFVGASDCLGSPYDTEGTRAGANSLAMSYKFDSTKGEIVLNIEKIVLNCAAIPKMDFKFNGDTIIFNAYDANTGDQADCICTYDLSSKVNGAESKVYYIRPEFATGEENVQVLELSQKSEGTVYFSMY